MSMETKTALGTILRQCAQGIYTREEAYKLITELYMRQLNNHNF